MHNHILIRLAGFTLGLLLCLWGVWSAGAAGLSRLFSRYALATRSLAYTDEAVLLSSSDPEAHYSRALVLKDKGNLTEAIRELERAADLRPRDYVFWYELALARDVAGDSDAAIAACEESVHLAPYYGRTHWLLGNLLFRAGRLDDAFTELRRASASDGEYLPNLMDLAWNTYQGDAQAVETAVKPETKAARLSLAKFFLKQGKINEALALYHSAGALSEAERQSLITDLLAAKKFNAAHEVWSSGNGAETSNQNGTKDAAIIDSGFEGRVTLKANSFGWQVASDLPTVKVSLDQNQPHSGAQSLRLDWNGNAQSSTALVSQLILVKAHTKYRLRFAARTEEIVSAGLPLISVGDASGDVNRLMAQSEQFPPSSTGWREYAFDFTTGDTTEAVQIRLERQGCPGAICPIFGRLWLDDFSLEKL